jgi:hypothetical protein
MGVEARLRELRDAGELSGLPGERKPLPEDPDETAGEAWGARRVARMSGARPLWTELRRDITERRMRIVTRLRAHQSWVARRQELLDHLPSERILSEVSLTKESDERLRAEVGHAIAELNALVRQHNLMVTATSLHLPTATFEGLLEIASAPRR